MPDTTPERYFARSHVASELDVHNGCFLFTYLLKPIPGDNLPTNYQESLRALYEVLRQRMQQMCANTYFQGVMFKVIYPTPDHEGQMKYVKAMSSPLSGGEWLSDPQRLKEVFITLFDACLIATLDHFFFTIILIMPENWEDHAHAGIAAAQLIANDPIKTRMDNDKAIAVYEILKNI